METNKPRILFVNNNMHIGGVQKALISLLTTIESKYDITLLLFHAEGELMSEIPESVHIVTTNGLYRYLGMRKTECTSLIDKVCRMFLAAVGNILGLKWVMELLKLFGKIDDLGYFDVVISYLHCSSPKSFYGGTAEYVLRYKHARKKVCYVHCDYVNSGTASDYSKNIYSHFDAIACVSHSVRQRFLSVLPQMDKRTFAISNPIMEEQIRELSQIDTYQYDSAYLNFLTVARLSEEKGVDRFVHVMSTVRGQQVRYYVVGDGKSREMIEQTIKENGLEEQVFLLGEDANPYRYMARADMLIVPSYHEAAPVVFQEAAALGLPVFTTRTTSAEEMIAGINGIVVDNNEVAMAEGIHDYLRRHKAGEKNNIVRRQCAAFDRKLFWERFDSLVSPYKNPQ